MDATYYILILGFIAYYAVKWGYMYAQSNIILALKTANPLICFSDIVIILFVFLQLVLEWGVPELRHKSLEIIGVMVFFLGILMASSGRISLKVKNSYLPAMKACRPKILVTSGPFRIIRNPVYAGTFIIGVGFEVALNSFFFFLVFLALPLLVLQISKEEKILAKTFPLDWEIYKKQVQYRIMPFLY